MSITQRMQDHQDDIARESQHVQDMMLKTQTGSDLMYASSEMASSDEMQGLMLCIEGIEYNVSEQDKFLMGKYMGQMLQDDPENGLLNYADYLHGIANDPTYASRSEYYNAIAESALKLHHAPTFQSYINKYKIFEADKSPEAEATRQAMEQMTVKMREWIEGEEGTAV